MSQEQRKRIQKDVGGGIGIGNRIAVDIPVDIGVGIGDLAGVGWPS